MYNLTNIKNKIENNELVFGCSVTFCDSSIAELLGDIGFDFIWLDMEHTPNSELDIKQHLMALRGTETAAFVRVSDHSPENIKPVIDMGPEGIIFPFINDAQDARDAVAECRYPPEGKRGFGPQRAAKYGLINSDEYIKEAEESFWKIVQIEHVEAVENLEKILSVEGVDSFVVGPNDLAGSLGLPGNTGHEKVKRHLNVIAEKARNFNIPYGVAIPFDPIRIKEWIERGADWIEIAGDFPFLVHRASEVYRKIENIK